jgi:tRNA pseudouridine13 synthase
MSEQQHAASVATQAMATPHLRDLGMNAPAVSDASDDGAAPSGRWRPFDDLPHAHGGPVIRARLRASPEDFIVDEVLAFGPDGEGEHRLLKVRKIGANTDWTARRIALLAGVPAKAVGYAGLKDRHAVTTQWFSVHLGKRPEPRWRLLSDDGIEVLESHPHRRKLKRGVLAGNRFTLRLRGVTGDRDAVPARLGAIAANGVPNYFGPQRFGRDAGNLIRADALFRGRAGRVSRHQRGLWLSAARSQVFNEVLAVRVERGDWGLPLQGDRLQLRGSHSHFLAEVIDDPIRERIASGDVLPTGPLVGDGAPLTIGDAAALEQRVLIPFAGWIAGLAEAGLRQERRALRLDPEYLESDWPAADELRLCFTLPAGSYATVLLRELVDWDEPER